MTRSAAYPDDDAASAKSSLRTQMLALRKAMRRADEQAPDKLAKLILDVLSEPRNIAVAGYVAIGDELDPFPTLEALKNAGASVVLPVAGKSGEVLAFRAWKMGEPMEKGPHNTLHPSKNAAGVTPDVVLVPLIAFDRFGYRLGFGGGYYDRTLPVLRAGNNIAAYGIGYDEQEVPHVPREDFDARLDGVFTPTRYVPASQDIPSAS